MNFRLRFVNVRPQFVKFRLRFVKFSTLIYELLWNLKNNDHFSSFCPQNNAIISRAYVMAGNETRAHFTDEVNFAVSNLRWISQQPCKWWKLPRVLEKSVFSVRCSGFTNTRHRMGWSSLSTVKYQTYPAKFCTRRKVRGIRLETTKGTVMLQHHFAFATLFCYFDVHINWSRTFRPALGPMLA